MIDIGLEFLRRDGDDMESAVFLFDEEGDLIVTLRGKGEGEYWSTYFVLPPDEARRVQEYLTRKLIK